MKARLRVAQRKSAKDMKQLLLHERACAGRFGMHGMMNDLKTLLPAPTLPRKQMQLPCSDFLATIAAR
jgi:hypothetical protein